MGRSLWFRVYAIQLVALLRLAFASAPHLLLNLAIYCNSPVHSSIGTPSHSYGASTACRHTVSGSISLPSRGSFHLSLTVLCAIGPYQCFALEGGPPCFPLGFSCPVVLWILLHYLLYTYRALTVSGSLSQRILFHLIVCLQSATPVRFPAPVWALPRSLAATRGISVDSFSSGYLDVSVHRVPSL